MQTSKQFANNFSPKSGSLSPVKHNFKKVVLQKKNIDTEQILLKNKDILVQKKLPYKLNTGETVNRYDYFQLRGFENGFKYKIDDQKLQLYQSENRSLQSPKSIQQTQVNNLIKQLPVVKPKKQFDKNNNNNNISRSLEHLDNKNNLKSTPFLYKDFVEQKQQILIKDKDNQNEFQKQIFQYVQKNGGTEKDKEIMELINQKNRIQLNKKFLQIFIQTKPYSIITLKKNQFIKCQLKAYHILFFKIDMETASLPLEIIVDSKDIKYYQTYENNKINGLTMYVSKDPNPCWEQFDFIFTNFLKIPCQVQYLKNEFNFNQKHLYITIFGAIALDLQIKFKTTGYFYSNNTQTQQDESQNRSNIQKKILGDEDEESSQKRKKITPDEIFQKLMKEKNIKNYFQKDYEQKIIQQNIEDLKQKNYKENKIQQLKIKMAQKEDRMIKAKTYRSITQQKKIRENIINIKSKQERIEERYNFERIYSEKQQLYTKFVQQWQTILTTCLLANVFQMHIFKYRLENVVAKLARRKIGYFILKQRQKFFKGKTTLKDRLLLEIRSCLSIRANVLLKVQEDKAENPVFYILNTLRTQKQLEEKINSFYNKVKFIQKYAKISIQKKNEDIDKLFQMQRIVYKDIQEDEAMAVTKGHIKTTATKYLSEIWKKQSLSFTKQVYYKKLQQFKNQIQEYYKIINTYDKDSRLMIDITNYLWDLYHQQFKKQIEGQFHNDFDKKLHKKKQQENSFQLFSENEIFFMSGKQLNQIRLDNQCCLLEQSTFQNSPLDKKNDLFKKFDFNIKINNRFQEVENQNQQQNLIQNFENSDQNQQDSNSLLLSNNNQDEQIVQEEGNKNQKLLKLKTNNKTEKRKSINNINQEDLQASPQRNSVLRRKSNKKSIKQIQNNEETEENELETSINVQLQSQNSLGLTTKNSLKRNFQSPSSTNKYLNSQQTVQENSSSTQNINNNINNNNNVKPKSSFRPINQSEQLQNIKQEEEIQEKQNSTNSNQQINQNEQNNNTNNSENQGLKQENTENNQQNQQKQGVKYHNKISSIQHTSISSAGFGQHHQKMVSNISNSDKKSMKSQNSQMSITKQSTQYSDKNSVYSSLGSMSQNQNQMKNSSVASTGLGFKRGKQFKVTGKNKKKTKIVYQKQSMQIQDIQNKNKFRKPYKNLLPDYSELKRLIIDQLNFFSETNNIQNNQLQDQNYFSQQQQQINEELEEDQDLQQQNRQEQQNQLQENIVEEEEENEDENEQNQ